MPDHHEVFSHFTPFRGVVPADFGIDFLGAKTRGQFIAGLYTHPTPTMLQTSYPGINEEYLEWIDLLESVVEARGSYTMIDLGAGFGRWGVRAAFALKQYNDQLPYRLIEVEAEPLVFKWMRLHFEDNGIDPSRHCLVHAATSDRLGDILFYIGGPRGGPWDRNPNDWYGQFLAKDYDVSGEYQDDGEYYGYKVRLHKSGWRSISVPSVTLASLMADLDRVDFLDMDIEGQELPVIRSTIEEMDTKVRRLHIGTHSKEIEDELRQLLSTHGWHCLRDYTLFSTSETPWGTVAFENGVQSWVNPRL
ncbi:MAG TPA: FkbM family methyltransferase [Bryobacteraceae bacterium]|nr:FkbM family methyltransferase [Bryobacteraceae bacterium]